MHQNTTNERKKLVTTQTKLEQHQLVIVTESKPDNTNWQYCANSSFEIPQTVSATMFPKHIWRPAAHHNQSLINKPI